MQKIVIDLFDDFPALIRRLGSDAKYDYFNNTWLNFIGRRLEDELGDGWMDDMHPDDFDRYFETFQKTFGREATFRYRIPADVEAYAVNHGHPEIMKTTDEKKRSLKIDYISEDIRNLIAESLDGADRVKEIVQDLKRFSRLDESKHKVADINAGLGSTINIVWNESKYKATLIKDFGNIPHIKCRPGPLSQVFMNLLINAVPAIDQHSEIRLKTWQDNGSINLTISDTGCWIPEDIQKRIFEPFYTTKEVGKGTGLGLSIDYDIIKKHNGEITVENEVGMESAFIISTPVAEI